MYVRTPQKMTRNHTFFRTYMKYVPTLRNFFQSRVNTDFHGLSIFCVSPWLSVVFLTCDLFTKGELVFMRSGIVAAAYFVICHLSFFI